MKDVNIHSEFVLHPKEVNGSSTTGLTEALARTASLTVLTRNHDAQQLLQDHTGSFLGRCFLAAVQTRENNSLKVKWQLLQIKLNRTGFLGI